MVKRRRILIALSSPLVGGCSLNSYGTSDSCGDLESSETMTEDRRLPDLEVRNDRSTTVQADIEVVRSEGRQCDRLDLDPGETKQYTKVFEGGVGYTVTVKADKNLKGVHTWERSRYDNLLLIIDIHPNDVEFHEMEQ